LLSIEIVHRKSEMSPEPQSQAKVASVSHKLWMSLHALRLHHWLKNCLLLVPAIITHAVSSNLSNLSIGFVAFGCASSANYLINDLLDKEHDRQDPFKRGRAQAAGHLSSRTVVGLTVVLVSAAAVCASSLPANFQLAVVTYLVVCLAYSLLLKRVRLIDILTLTILFDLRLAAGAAAIKIPLPTTLLLGSSCFFFTLAVSKRITQVSASKAVFERLPGRPYGHTNLPTLRVLAGAGGVTSVLISAIFISDVITRGAASGALWFVLLLQATWLSRCYFAATRGRLNEDLVLFIITDVPSCGIALAALVLTAAG
jgi:4-hydroxybenzoate polyprenyltransferase